MQAHHQRLIVPLRGLGVFQGDAVAADAKLRKRNLAGKSIELEGVDLDLALADQMHGTLKHQRRNFFKEVGKTFRVQV